MRLLLACMLALFGGFLLLSQNATDDLRFVILGDRTGDPQPGVYEQIWQETADDDPDFVINVGDTIQGENDDTVKREWQDVKRFLRPYARYRFFYTPGNHDVWSDASAAAYRHYTGHPLHYSFDHGPTHFSVLDNSRTADLPPPELDWLEHDLAAHPKAATKFVFSHRPSWLLSALMRDRDFPLQSIAKKYHVQYVIAGHIHQMLHFNLDGIMYLSVASSGGHLRNSQRYPEGWFFQHTLVTVHNGAARFDIKEALAPHGAGRVSHPDDWGADGLRSAERNAHSLYSYK